LTVCSGLFFSYPEVETKVTEMSWVKKYRSEEFVKIGIGLGFRSLGV
jgi:hypothetical protein